MGGRKFWITILGMAVCTFRPEVSEAIAALVLGFNGANTAVSWAYARRNDTSYDVDERRDPVIGFEATP